MSRLRSGCIIVALLLPHLCSAQSPANPPSGDQLYRSATGLLNRGLYDMAAAEYEQFLSGNPSGEKANLARYGLAVCRYRTGKLEDARAQLDKVELTDDFAFKTEVGLLKAQCSLSRKDFDQAVTLLAEIVRGSPKHDLADDSVALLCEALYGQGKYAEAADLGQQFVRRWAESPLRERVDFVRALSQMARGEFADAAERFESWLITYPNAGETGRATLLAGQCHLQSHALDAAAKRFREVIDGKPSPHAPQALLGLATALYQKNEKSQAATFLDRLAAEPSAADAALSGQLLRARICIDSGEYARALALLEPLTQDGPQAIEAGYWAAKCLLRQDKHAEAAERLSALAGRSAESAFAPQIRYDLAVARLKGGDQVAALRELRSFQETYAKHELAADAQYLIASALHQGKKFEESKAACEEFLKRYESHDRANSVQFLMAENEFLLGRHAAALALYEQAARRSTDPKLTAQAELRAGLALHRLGRADEAEVRLARVVKAGTPDAASMPAWLALADVYFQRSEWSKAEPLIREYLAATPPPPAADDALLKLGLCRLRQQDSDGALTSFDALLEKHPSSSHRLQALFERGQALLALKRETEARQAFEQVLAADPSSRFAPFANQHLAALAAKGQDYKAAAERYRLVAEVEKNTPAATEAMLRRGEALLAASEYRSAEESLRSYVSAGAGAPDSVKARAMLAIAVARQDRHEEALQLIDDAGLSSGGATKLEPALAAALRQEQAWCLRKLSRSSEAAAAYAALLQGPGGERNATAMLELAELQAADEKHAGAAELLRRVRGLSSSDPAAVSPEVIEPALYRLGICEFKLERFAESAAALEEMIAKFPSSKLLASASYFCGEAMFRLNAHDKAAVHLARVVESFASDPAAGPSLLRLGEVLALLQRWPRSESCFSQFLEKFPTSENTFQAKFGVGWARENQGRFDEAINAYREVVDKHQGPTAARAQFQIGECLLAKKQYEEAARELLKVDILYAYPEWSAAALFEAGKCFELLGKPVEARAQFETVVTKYKDSKWHAMATKRLEALKSGGLPDRVSLGRHEGT